jgi:hypothetical protein
MGFALVVLAAVVSLFAGRLICERDRQYPTNAGKYVFDVDQRRRL